MRALATHPLGRVSATGGRIGFPTCARAGPHAGPASPIPFSKRKGSGRPSRASFVVTKAGELMSKPTFRGISGRGLFWISDGELLGTDRRGDGVGSCSVFASPDSISTANMIAATSRSAWVAARVSIGSARAPGLPGRAISTAARAPAGSFQAGSLHGVVQHTHTPSSARPDSLASPEWERASGGCVSDSLSGQLKKSI